MSARPWHQNKRKATGEQGKMLQDKHASVERYETKRGGERTAPKQGETMVLLKSVQTPLTFTHFSPLSKHQLPWTLLLKLTRT